MLSRRLGNAYQRISLSAASTMRFVYGPTSSVVFMFVFMKLTPCSGATLHDAAP